MGASPPAALDSPLVGFRAWRVTRQGLRCLTSDDVWPVAGVIDARCERPEPGLVAHQAPARGCRCGAYAVDSLATLRRYLGWHERARLLPRRDVVVGAVQLWGAPGRPVIVGELRGRPGLQFRAPHARLLALAASPRLSRLGSEPGVPVVPIEGLEVLAREIGGVQLRPPGTGGRAGERPARGSGAEAREWAAGLLVLAGWLCRTALWLARRGWPALRRLLTWRLTRWAAGIGAVVLLYHAFPVFMGLATAAGGALALLLGVLAWGRRR